MPGVPLGPRSEANKIYPNGPWTWYTDDVIMAVASDSSPIEDWIPTVGVDATTYETVSHLNWDAPSGWDGEDYVAFINALNVGECDFGDLAPKFQGCQYTVPFGQSSAKSRRFDLEKDFGGLPYRQSRPITVRTGNGSTQVLANNYEFEIALTTKVFQQHLLMDFIYGVRANNPDMWSDGLLEVIRNGYVEDHMVGDGDCSNIDPHIIDGSVIATEEDLLRILQTEVQARLAEAEMRGMPINTAANDMVIAMPRVMWEKLTWRIPVGGLYPANPQLLTGGNTVELANFYRDRLLTGGLGSGYLPVAGNNIPILPMDILGMNVDNRSAVVSDILILVRRAGALNLLQRQFINWNSYAAPPDTINAQNTAGGQFRVGWMNENDLCYKWYIKARHRLVSYYQPLQTRITSVRIDNVGYDYLRSTSYTDAYYANYGVPGSIPAGWGE